MGPCAEVLELRNNGIQHANMGLQLPRLSEELYPSGVSRPAGLLPKGSKRNS